MSQNMLYYLKVPANFIPIQILPDKVGRPMLNFGRSIVKCTPNFDFFLKKKVTYSRDVTELSSAVSFRACQKCDRVCQKCDRVCQNCINKGYQIAAREEYLY